MHRNFIMVVGVMMMTFAGSRMATQLGLTWELTTFALGILAIGFSYTVESKKKIEDLELRISVLEGAPVNGSEKNS